MNAIAKKKDGIIKITTCSDSGAAESVIPPHMLREQLGTAAGRAVGRAVGDSSGKSSGECSGICVFSGK